MNKLDLSKIGNTPIKRLANIEKEYGINIPIFAKLENLNLTGSIKDRAVLQMLLDDMEIGRIKKGDTIIEATSGNTGISLAALGQIFELNIIIVMPNNVSVERRNLIKGYNATLELVEGGMKECSLRAQDLVKTIPNAIILGQFEHPSNFKAHYLNTAKEIVKDLKDVKYIFAGIGSGGTISGIGKYIKENKLDICCLGVEPYESPLITKGKAGPHLIQGIGANFIPKNYLKEYVDDVLLIKGEEAINLSNYLLEVEDINVGYSSGANLLACINYIKENNIQTGEALVIFPDDGGRYR